MEDIEDLRESFELVLKDVRILGYPIIPERLLKQEGDGYEDFDVDVLWLVYKAGFRVGRG